MRGRSVLLSIAVFCATATLTIARLFASPSMAEPEVPAASAAPVSQKCPDGFAFIPAGSFLMGSPEGELYRRYDEQQHQATISKPFCMAVREVTQDLWERVMGSNPSRFKKCGKDCPVENVTWVAIQEFIKKYNKMNPNDGVYRLPTEAEWEYAARGGATETFYSGNISTVPVGCEYDTDPGCVPDEETECETDPALDIVAWYCGNSAVTYPGGENVADLGGSTSQGTHPTGLKAPNRYGLYDMLGNVREWVSDWDFDDTFQIVDAVDPKGPETGYNRVNRGCSWIESPSDCRVAYRLSNTPDGTGGFNLGFRLLLELP